MTGGGGDKRAAREDRGAKAESLAVAFLEQRGVRVIARNYRCRHGEIDVIARDGDTLVFVEVRLRSNPNFGNAAASITAPKQARLTAAAAHYLAGHTATNPCRFDAVLLDRLDEPQIQWLRDVITA